MKENRNYLFKNANIYVDKDGHSYAVDKDGNIIGTKGVSYLLPEITISPKVSTPWEAALITSKRNPNWRLTYDMSPNSEVLNAITAGVFNWGLSPTTSARILWDAAHGDFDKIGKGVVFSNNGVFSDKYAAEHPWISLGGNMIGDILSPLAWNKTGKLAARAGKGVINEFRRQAVLNRLSPVLGSGIPIRNTSDEITSILELAFSDYLERKDVGKLFKDAEIKEYFKDDIRKFLDKKSAEITDDTKFNRLANFKKEILGDKYIKYSQKQIKNAYVRAINNVKNMSNELAEILGSDEGLKFINNIKNEKNKKKILDELKTRKTNISESEAPTGEVAAPEPAKPEVPTGETTPKTIDEVSDNITPEVNTTSNTLTVVTETPLTTVQLTTSVPITETIPTDEIVEQAAKQADNVLPNDLPYYAPNGNTYVIYKGTKITKEGDNLFAKDNFGNKIRIDKKPDGDYNISEGPQKGFSSEMADNLLDTEEYKYTTIKGNNDGTFTFEYKPVSKFYSLYTTSTKPGKASQLWDVLMNRLSKNPTKTESGVYPKITGRNLSFSAADMPEKGNKFIPGGRQFSIPRTLGSTLGLGYLFGGHKFINNYIQPTAKIAKNYYVGPSENGATSGWNQDITSLEGVPMDTFHVGKDIYGVPNVKFNIKDGEYIQESNGKYYQMYPLREMDNSFTPKGEAIYGTINSANKYLFPNETNKTKNASQSYTTPNVTKASSLPSVGEDTIQTTLLTQQLQPQLKTQQLKNQEIIDLMGFINRTNPLYKIINNYA